MISVSVAMATYNGGRYIRQQLTSLAAQSHLPAEIVVVDDGSTDETLEIVREFARTGPIPVHIYQNKIRLGYRANFLHAVTLCTSDLIAFCDQDDVWFPLKLTTCASHFDDENIQLVFHNAIVVTEEGRPIGSLDRNAAPQSINPPLSTNPWTYGLGFTSVFRRSLPLLPDLWAISLDHNDLLERMSHDQWFFFLSSVLGSIAYVKKPLAYYRQHGNNLFGWAGTRSYKDFTLNLFTNFYETYDRFEKCCHRRAEILDVAKNYWKGAWRSRASAAVLKYVSLGEQYSDRKTIYNSVEISQRMRAFVNILSAGGYKQAAGYTIGPKGLARDSLGVCLGPRLRRDNF
jgi:glycosyltransferase involved in cell wall biosynthesis